MIPDNEKMIVRLIQCSIFTVVLYGLFIPHFYNKNHPGGIQPSDLRNLVRFISFRSINSSNQ